MAQQHVDTPEIIYDTLTSDSVFIDLVGTRTFKAGSTQLDAISILTPGESLPAIKSQQGLEVIIHDVTELGRQDFISDPHNIKTIWKVFLLAWPDANGETLRSAATRIMELFTGSTTIETNPVPSGLGAIAQLLVLIPSEGAVGDIIPLEEYRLTTLSGDELVTLDGRYIVTL
jgi:hypothetical protein